MNNYLETDPMSGEITLHEVTEQHHNRYHIGWLVSKKRLSGMERIFIPEYPFESFFVEPDEAYDSMRSNSIEGLHKQILEAWEENAV